MNTDRCYPEAKSNLEMAYSSCFLTLKKTLINYKFFSKSQPTAETLFSMSVPIPFPVEKKTKSFSLQQSPQSRLLERDHELKESDLKH